ncbi:hypothetical protein IEQ34_020250 [Dendrobium chrysotoxum]|uniref:Bulb-type lectin domain-containing protein n=1 Tax=Dendrobium chrysotoxum TaxID=161865 RepID=A0AAV7G1J1_DENCH|nr:hypothetical protein IEQ34_020250 [Dendrobium chrysotoxum]
MHAKPLHGTINSTKMEQLHHSVSNNHLIHSNFIVMASVGCNDSFLNIIHLCFFLLIVLISASRSKAFTNVLLTGQTLEPQAKLSYADTGVNLTMRPDCYLVLYNSHGKPIWYSKTSVLGGQNCFLSLTDNGRLVVRNPRGHLVWISSNANSKVGKYVAILLPEGKVSIYGPEVWSVWAAESISSSSNNSNEMVTSTENLQNSPSVYDVLFSGQVLYNDGKLTNNGYNFIMTKECELVLQKGNGVILWHTRTRGYGENCFARLNHKGGLETKDDYYRTVWRNSETKRAQVGEYVLVMQKNGKAVIYGPKVWSTAHVLDDLIELPTAEK